MSNQELIKKLQEELSYTQIESNIQKLYTFLMSDTSKSISDYQKILLETQLNAMNVYRNTLILRLSNFQALEIEAQQSNNEVIDESSSY